MSVPNVLQKITTALDQAGIPYMLSGSFASAYYGTPRSTQDIDLVIETGPDQLRVFVTSLPSHEYYVDLNAALDAYKRQSLFNVIDLATGWKLDFVICKSRSFSKQEFRRRQRVCLDELDLFIASAEDVIISKLEWSRLAQSHRQIDDVTGILRARWDSLDRAYLETWITSLSLEKEWNDAKREAEIGNA
jgi:uncharacterized nucleotidyltransferase DUF6036